MKKLSLFATLFIYTIVVSAQQWDDSTTPGDIYYNQGNVGIGISTPDQKLEVNGGIRADQIIGPKTSNLIIQGQDIGDGNGYGLEFYAVQNGIDFKTFDGSWASRLYIQDNGHIGINNPSPNVQFDVNGDIATSGRLISPLISGTSSGNLVIQGQDIGGGNGYGLEFYAVQNGIDFKTFDGSWASRLYIQDNGAVGIGTTIPDSKLTVAGNIHSKEVKVTATAGADFVFDESYKLRSLEETEKFIQENKHLPEVAPAKEMIENGIQLGEMNIKLLQKIEELTLYLIEQNKRIEKLEQQNGELLKKLENK